MHNSPFASHYRTAKDINLLLKPNKAFELLPKNLHLVTHNQPYCLENIKSG